MKRPHRSEKDHMYHISGKKYPELFGSRTQVMNGTAYKTSGNLTKSNLMMNKWGRIVSAKKHRTAKSEKRLQKYGFFAKKGKFGYVKKSVKKGSKSRKTRGGKRQQQQQQQYQQYQQQEQEQQEQEQQEQEQQQEQE